jgi:hypothetical protein
MPLTYADKAELGVPYNYLSNGGGERSTSGWSAFNTTFTSGVPGTITAGSTKLSVAQVTTNILAGNASLQLNCTTAASSAGHGVICDAITLQDGDLGKLLSIYLDYNFVAGQSNVDVSGTSTQTLEVWVYNVGLATWYQPAGFRSINTKGTSTQLVPGTTPAITFQSEVTNTSNTNQYRVALIIRNAPGGTFQMNFDGVYLGRQAKSYGPVVTDWISYTPTGGWTGSVVYTGKYRRVGDSLDLQLQVACTGAPTGGALYFTLPSGLQVDETKLEIQTADPNYTPLGIFAVLDNGLTVYEGDFVYSAGSPTVVSCRVQASNTTYGQIVSQLNVTTPMTFGNTDGVVGYCRVPIVGWSSNLQISSGDNSRLVAARYTYASQSVPTTSFTTLLTGMTKAYDTHNAMDTSTGGYTIPVSGKYRIGGSVGWTGVLGSGAYIGTYLKKNSTSPYVSLQFFFSGSPYGRPAGGTTLDLVAGDVIYLQVYQETGGSIPSSGDPVYDWFCIERLSGSQTLAAADSVTAIYKTSAGQSISNTTITIVDFGTKELDLTNSVTTGASWKFTAPISGTYLICGMCTFVSNNTGVRELYLYKNGSSWSHLYTSDAAQSSQASGMPGSRLIYLNAGDYIDLRVNQTCGGPLTLDASTSTNSVSIVRVGN